MWWNCGTGSAGWVVMSLALVAFGAIVVFAIVAIFRGGGREVRHGGGSPQQLLDERFARGEIDAEEYHGRRDTVAAKR